MSEDKSKRTVGEIVKKALVFNGQWDKDSFPEYGDVIYWMRQAIGLGAGILCGAIPLTDIMGFATFLIAIIALPYFFYTNYSKINIYDFGATAMLGEGMTQSFGVFLLSWIIVYSGMNF
jgi:hypothetical protein